MTILTILMATTTTTTTTTITITMMRGRPESRQHARLATSSRKL
jgi:hypothetical protein